MNRSLLASAFFVVVFSLAGASLVAADADEPTAPPTLRVELYQTGNHGEERWSLGRVVVEPLPWPGPPAGPLDDLDRGVYRFTVADAHGKPWFRDGFATIFAEWQTTAEAKTLDKTFPHALRFPMPSGPVTMTIERRDARNAFQSLWTVPIDPDAPSVDRSTPPRHAVHTIQHRGEPAAKADLVFLGDGYTAERCPAFLQRARDLTETLFRYDPYRARRDDFNVRAICPPAAVAGVSRPSTGVFRDSPLGARYDTFGSERYVLAEDDHAWRAVASWAPYEFTVILLDSEVYGGGGIYGLYATVAAENPWADYLFIHELGHHFAALADEYYTSSVAYETPPVEVEPWEPNITALLDGTLKWRRHIASGVPIPTAWPKDEYETHARSVQERRRALRARDAPEAEMSALFARQRDWETDLFSRAEHQLDVGAFEGAGYLAQGLYRPQLDCVMFSRNRVPFCAVCAHAIEAVIDRWAPR